MPLIHQLTTRPRLGLLGHIGQAPSWLLKQTSRCYARPGQIFKRQQKDGLKQVLRQSLWSSRRGYSGNSYSHYTPQSFWARNKPAIVTSGAVGLCCATYYCQWTGARLAKKGDLALSVWIRQNFVNSAENIREGRWWVIFSSSLAHGNPVHLGFNMLALWGFGSYFVGIFGVRCFVGLWTISAASCSAAQILWQHTQERLRSQMVSRRWDKPEDPSILGIRISRERALAISGGSSAFQPHYGGSLGASGVLSGLTSTFWCFAPKMMVRLFLLPMPLWLFETLFTMGSVFCMATGSVPQVGHAGHLGGMVAGVAYYYGVARPWLRRVRRF